MPIRVDEDSPAREAGFDPKWYLWNNQRDHFYTHSGEATWVRVCLLGGEALPAWRGTEEIRFDPEHGGTAYFDPEFPEIVNEAYRDLEAGDRLGGGEYSRRMYRVWMERGESLRIRLGGRPTINGAAEASWGDSGDMEDWMEGRVLVGGYPDGGDAEAQGDLTVQYGTLYNNNDMFGRTGWTEPEFPWMSPVPPSDYTLQPQTWTRTIGPWHSAAGAGSSRVWLRSASGVERPIIIEPGEGAPTMFTVKVQEFPLLAPPYTLDEFYYQPWSKRRGPCRAMSTGTTYTIRKGDPYWYEYTGPYSGGYDISEDGVPPFHEYSQGDIFDPSWSWGDLPPDRWSFWYSCWDDDVWQVGAPIEQASNAAEYGTIYFSYLDPEYGSGEYLGRSQNALNAARFSGEVLEGDPDPTPPGDDEAPRKPRRARTVAEFAYNAYYSSYNSVFVTRFGEPGWTSKGGSGQASSCGPRMGGGGGFGGGPAGNCDQWSKEEPANSWPPTSLHNEPFTSFRRISQFSGWCGGRWWNTDRVQHISDADLENANPSWLPEPGDPGYDPEQVDLLWPTHRSGYTGCDYTASPYLEHRRFGPPPYEDEPWKFGFGAMWLCPEIPLDAKRAKWRVGHVGWGRNNGW